MDMRILTNMPMPARRFKQAALLLVAVGALLTVSACREDMQNQPKYVPLRESSFFPDQRSARLPVEGTIARGQLEDDSLLYTGKVDGKESAELPFAMTAADMQRGRERYNIYCSPCHSQLGDGNGMIVQRGFKKPPSYFEPRLVQAPIGHFFNVMTRGYGAMAEYSSQVPVADRWRIAAYIRALQLTQTAKGTDVPAGVTVASHAPTEGEAPKEAK
ncbi:MAG: cytochrome c [Acidobacteriota bacterium]|nr:cytochrome c [Acidobacteriota bacterium]